MSLLYTCISEDNKILCDYSSVQGGDIIKMVKKLLKKVSQNPRGVITYENYKYHYLNGEDDGLTYLVMTEEQCSNEGTQKFLDEVKELFHRKISSQELQEALAKSKEEKENCLNPPFSDYLKGKLLSFTHEDNDSDDNITQLKNNLLDYRDIVVSANEELLKREELVNHINDKAETLRNDSSTFYSSSKKVKKKTKCNKCLIIPFTIVLILIIAYGCAAIYCRGFLFEGCLNK